MNKNKFLSSSELLHLETQLKPHLKLGNRDALLITVAAKTGARASEVLALTKADLNMSERSVFIRGLKNSNDREIPLPLQLFQQLAKYVEPLAETDKLFDISYPRLHQIWQWYKPCEKKFHALRHTFAINLYRNTKNIHLVKTALGHKSIGNSLIYLEFVTSQDDLKKALR